MKIAEIYRTSVEIIVLLYSCSVHGVLKLIALRGIFKRHKTTFCSRKYKSFLKWDILYIFADLKIRGFPKFYFFFKSPKKINFMFHPVFFNHVIFAIFLTCFNCSIPTSRNFFRGHFVLRFAKIFLHFFSVKIT